jgi:hypothetical protein
MQVWLRRMKRFKQECFFFFGFIGDEVIIFINVTIWNIFKNTVFLCIFYVWRSANECESSCWNSAKLCLNSDRLFQNCFLLKKKLSCVMRKQNNAKNVTKHINKLNLNCHLDNCAFEFVFQQYWAMIY